MDQMLGAGRAFTSRIASKLQQSNIVLRRGNDRVSWCDKILHSYFPVYHVCHPVVFARITRHGRTNMAHPDA
jgi:hypothetical protein